MKTDVDPPVFQGQRLQFHPPGHRFPAFKIRCRPVQDMLVRIIQHPGHTDFQRPHQLHIHIFRAGDQIPLVCVLPCQGIGDQMAAVIEKRRLRIDDPGILFLSPAAGPDLPDLPPLCLRHHGPVEKRHGASAASQPVRLTVGFPGKILPVVLRESGPVSVQLDHIPAVVVRDQFRRRLRNAF